MDWKEKMALLSGNNNTTLDNYSHNYKNTTTKLLIFNTDKGVGIMRATVLFSTHRNYGIEDIMASVISFINGRDIHFTIEDDMISDGSIVTLMESGKVFVMQILPVLSVDSCRTFRSFLELSNDLLVYDDTTVLTEDGQLSIYDVVASYEPSIQCKVFKALKEVIDLEVISALADFAEEGINMFGNIDESTTVRDLRQFVEVLNEAKDMGVELETFRQLTVQENVYLWRKSNSLEEFYAKLKLNK